MSNLSLPVLAIKQSATMTAAKPRQAGICTSQPWTNGGRPLHRRLAVLPTNRAGSNADRLVVVFPCRMSCAMASPVAGPFRIPQQLWPDATYTPSTPGSLQNKGQEQHATQQSNFSILDIFTRLRMSLSKPRNQSMICNRARGFLMQQPQPGDSASTLQACKPGCVHA